MAKKPPRSPNADPGQAGDTGFDDAEARPTRVVEALRGPLLRKLPHPETDPGDAMQPGAPAGPPGGEVSADAAAAEFEDKATRVVEALHAIPALSVNSDPARVSVSEEGENLPTPFVDPSEEGFSPDAFADPPTVLRPSLRRGPARAARELPVSPPDGSGSDAEFFDENRTEMLDRSQPFDVPLTVPHDSATDSQKDLATSGEGGAMGRSSPSEPGAAFATGASLRPGGSAEDAERPILARPDMADIDRGAFDGAGETMVLHALHTAHQPAAAPTELEPSTADTESPAKETQPLPQPGERPRPRREGQRPDWIKSSRRVDLKSPRPAAPMRVVPESAGAPRPEEPGTETVRVRSNERLPLIVGVVCVVVLVITAVGLVSFLSGRTAPVATTVEVEETGRAKQALPGDNPSPTASPESETGPEGETANPEDELANPEDELASPEDEEGE